MTIDDNIIAGGISAKKAGLLRDIPQPDFVPNDEVTKEIMILQLLHLDRFPMPDSSLNTLSLQEKLSLLATIRKTLGISMKSSISHTPGVCGGVACIRQTRIPVWSLIEMYNQNIDILSALPSLTTIDIQTALEYYTNHKDEIDQQIIENN